MSEDLKRIYDLAQKSIRVNASSSIQLHCWKRCAEQAANENNTEIFDQACEIINTINKR